MKTIDVTLPEHNETELHFISDVHIGDRLCDKRLLKQKLEEIKAKENAYIILGGDLMNTAIKSSVSDCYNEEMNPMQQLEACVNIFEPVKDRILAVIGGNHEARISKADSIDITKILATQLGKGNEYASGSAILFIRTGSRQKGGRKGQILYTVYSTHGTGRSGGKRSGGKVNSLIDYMNIVDADIYVAGHVHEPEIIRKTFFKTDNQRRTITPHDKLFVSTASWLDYPTGNEGGYGDVFGFSPSTKRNPVIYLNGTEKDFSAKL